MNYREDKNGNPISLLGYGCMRFTQRAGKIDIDKAEKEIMEAYEAGVNYYDTAYLYPGSEAALGEILSRNKIRDKVNIATKLPQYLVTKKEGLDKYFDEELRRLKTDHVDYYLLHMLNDVGMLDKLKALGVEEWISQKKKSGAIRNIGFSFHGDTQTFLKLLDAYDWDFCQIQYNYMDENGQAGRKGLQAAFSKGIPVIIMEPLRGGRLVNMLPEKAKKMIASYEKGYTPAELGLRWLWEQEEVTCVLSGMNSIDMVRENVRIASQVSVGEFGPSERELIEKVKNEIDRTMKVGCTGCGYCMPCPHGVDIPGTFRCWNVMYSENKSSGREEYMRTASLKKNPSYASLCVQCGACEKHCPQNIEIRKNLKEADKALRPWYMRFITFMARLVMKV